MNIKEAYEKYLEFQSDDPPEYLLEKTLDNINLIKSGIELMEFIGVSCPCVGKNLVSTVLKDTNLTCKKNGKH